MDGVHEAHLSRILEGRRRRGVLGNYSEPVAAPPPQARHVSPPPPPPPAPRRVSSAAGTQTVEERKYAAAAQTAAEWDGEATQRRYNSAAAAGPSPAGNADWRQSVPRTNGFVSGAFAAAAPPPPPPLPPNPNATLDGAVRFQSPARVPSLAYSTPATSPSASSGRQRPSLWRQQQQLNATPPPAWASPLAEDVGWRSVEPLPPPLYIPRSRSPLHEPRGGGYGSGGMWQPLFSAAAPSRPAFDDPPPFTSGWRTQPDTHYTFSSGLHVAPLSMHRDDGGVSSMTGWPSEQRESGRHRGRRPSRHRSHHRHQHRQHRSPRDYRDSEAEREVDFPPPRRQRSARRDASRRRSSASAAPGRSPSRRQREEDPRRGRGYAPPVVYMGSHPSEMRASSPSSMEGASQQRRRRSPPRTRPVEEPRKTALGLPDARSTMDLRTSIETLRAGDWFYKWTTKGDAVHRRWVWVDTKSYLLVWSNKETRNPNFCGDVRLDHICQVTSRDLTSVDEDGFPKTYYVLLIETTKRVLQLATELKDKCDAWFEALNNVMGFIHRNDIAKGAQLPD